MQGIRPVVLEGKSLTSFPFNTSNSTPAPTTCKGFFAGLTLFDLFFFFLTLLKKYQKVQFACFALDTDGVLVYGKKKFLNQEASAVERRGGRGSHTTESQAQTEKGHYHHLAGAGHHLRPVLGGSAGCRCLSLSRWT
ncbi:MAG: hypothetical protein J6V57_06345, partial [Spirochaetaceae bacterium]|nr:hypothetical protein [Spirochaetaceae bacterium]